ncbi:hypothetical protein CVT24_011477 [Panaeolus cyanescens]|uniref:HMG box domain-containing protein n=1 Tax=Panaeolus cyanescens TaxID=181874 RepID=A0A409VGI0_9AGAR|nr:hypothetical protein CVT24_011477 [Panaeolus cyanescens]
MPQLAFEDASNSDHLIFGPIDLDTPYHWDNTNPYNHSIDHGMNSMLVDDKSFFSYDLVSPTSPTSHSPTTATADYNPAMYSPGADDSNAIDITHWINDPDLSINTVQAPSPSSPIPIPSPTDSVASSSFLGYPEHNQHQFGSLSPTAFAVPRSLSPSSPSSFDSFDDFHHSHVHMHHQQQQQTIRVSARPRVHSVISARDLSSMHPHSSSWNNNHFWDAPSAIRTHSNRPSIRHSPMSTTSPIMSTINTSSLHSNSLNDQDDLGSSTTTIRQRIPIRRASLGGIMFQSASAPTLSDPLGNMIMARNYSKRAGSAMSDERDSVEREDKDATIRRRKREETPAPISASTSGSASISGSSSSSKDGPLKSVLRPPKLAPSAWQLYFTDWIQKQQASGTRKLNVAQAAKEAGQEYACLSAAEKEPYKRRSQAMKEAREKEHEAYMRTLTPEDIKRENLFRAAQRKAGKSRKSNIKDPNAPKKPLSAYFMFLQRIRANPHLVKDIFGDETETTKQSVLAAAKWRSMTDAERQPFLAQAEQEKMEYEAARRLYEEGTTGFGGNASASSINFSIMPGLDGSSSFGSMSLPFSIVKTESESESDQGFSTDDSERPNRVPRS